MSQAELGRRIGLKQNSVSDLERDETPLTTNLLERLAKALETTRAYFIQGPEGPDVPDEAKRTVEAFLYGLGSGWRNLAALPEDERRELGAQVKALLAVKQKSRRAKRRGPARNG